MSTIADALEAVAGRLVDAGVAAATTDPALVGPLVSAHRYAALVDAPAVARRDQAGGLHLAGQVHLLCAPPGTAGQWEPLWQVLPTALDALNAGAAQRQTHTIGDIDYPGYLLELPLRIGRTTP